MGSDRSDLAARQERERRCRQVAMPRADQGIVDSLAATFAVERLPDDMRRLLARIR